jgi:hypothetical protein
MPAGGTVPEAIIGSDESPATLEVDASVEEPAIDTVGRSRVTFSAEYVSFDGLSKLPDSHDWYVFGEADFMYRFRGPLWAMRIGVAALQGEGGNKDDILAGLCDGGGTACRRVAFNYAYFELEFKLHDLVHVMARPLIGGGYETDNATGDPDFDQWQDSTGFKGKVRVGRERETNLVLGFAVFGDRISTSTSFDAAFTWNVLPEFPIVLGTQVTNLPAGESTGVRLLADLGWRRVDWVYPTLRVAYQARNIDLTGLSIGLGVNFDW